MELSSVIHLKERFEAKFVVANGCWSWNGAKSQKGYGMLKFGKTSIGAHRLSWIFAHGDLQDGLMVCHHCDNPSCVNPDHLFVGSAKDNALDMVNKGRNIAPIKKLEPEQVSEIKQRYRRGDSKSKLSREFHVSRSTISNALLVKTYKQLGEVR